MHHSRLPAAQALSPCCGKSAFWRQHTIDNIDVHAQHMALTIDEELSLHNRLLTELDDDVTVTHSRMKVQTHQT